MGGRMRSGLNLENNLKKNKICRNIKVVKIYYKKVLSFSFSRNYCDTVL